MKQSESVVDHPTDYMRGYRDAIKDAIKALNDKRDQYLRLDSELAGLVGLAIFNATKQLEYLPNLDDRESGESLENDEGKTKV